ncbi:TAXI family TRAP transporter solute-binding subunit [Ramlibacter sp. AN1015]|uniref:TAXI family TRAP transporter solute-binding subunit n=1 Tax=Ramlibacter sp. AN1015 TaxID=3133428 RepID=UPI0030C434F7
MYATKGKASAGRRWMRQLLLLSGFLVAAAAPAETIVTGGKTGTYYQIGLNLKDIVAPALQVRESKGSWANVEDLSQTKGVGLAIVQSDVYSAFVYLRDNPQVPSDTRRQYAHLLANLRVFMPLYREEIHFLVRKDSPLEYIHQIQGARIWMDAEKSGTYLTALNIYSKMFNERPTVVSPFLNPTVIGDDEGTRTRRSALMVLSDPDYYKDFPAMDVVVLVGGQPLKLLETNIPDNLKLLKFDPNHPASARLLQEYKRADIQQTSYPLLNIADASQPSLSVDSYLITANFIDPSRQQFVAGLADRFCESFDELQAKGHPKWKALTWKPGSPLPALSAGWQYSSSVKEHLSRCAPQETASLARSACRPQDRFAGLCR